jgi:ATP-dependent helicase/nuclease subunit B
MDTFFTTITSNDLILTVNRRLSIYLRKKYDNIQAKLEKKAWPSVNILPLYSWLEKIWGEHVDDHRILLSDLQELIIWEKIIANSIMGEQLLRPLAAASQAKESWALLQYWMIDFEYLKACSLSTDTQMFADWAMEFMTICNESEWISRACLPSLLLNHLSEQVITHLPNRIVLVGFDDFQPIVNELFAKLKPFCEVIYWANQQQIAEAYRLSCTDLEYELLTMARWAYENLATKDSVTIGCVVPTLSSIRNTVERIFTEVFYARNLQQQFAKLPFNISAANCLAEYPPITSALLILKMGLKQLTHEEFSYLLRSPFLGGSENEISARARLDVALRSVCEQKINLNDLYSQSGFQLSATQRSTGVYTEGCEDGKKDYDATQNSTKNKELNYLSEYLLQCPLLLKGLRELLSLIETDLSSELSQSCQQWAYLFNKMLLAMGWPGDRSLNSQEFQLCERWQALLQEFSTLDFILEKQTFKQALNLIQQIATRTLFQPKSDDMPIQILGVLETSGIYFDQLWVMGLDNENWPAAPNPNSFIPIELQRQLNMPHATSERELQFSQILTNRLCKSTEKIIFSHSAQDGDRLLTASPLILEFPELQLETFNYLSLDQQIYSTTKIEYFEDIKGPPILNMQNQSMKGGSWIFKTQAACPFRAFAEIRLFAQELDFPHFGLAAHERGTLVHEILAQTWRIIKGHQNLCSLNDEELLAIISPIIDAALDKIKQQKPFIGKSRLLVLEKQRLQKLILQWLHLEKNRQHFTVLSCEERRVAKISEIEINVQIDRIDQLADKSQIIIDYKTGIPSVTDWFGERPEEPQLPLYCIISETTIAGLLFAQVRSDKMQFKGLTEINDIAPGAITLDKLKNNKEDFNSWQDLIAKWQINLNNLANEFCSGYAAVKPKDPITTCQYCGLQGLCRINEVMKNQSQENE